MPNDDEPPEMNEPDDEQRVVLAMPKNAPLHLRMVLQHVRDQAQQQALIDTYNEMGPGMQAELFGNVAAYFSAILDYQIDRGTEGADELFAVAGQLRTVSEEWGTALIAFEKVVAAIQAGGEGGQPTASQGGTPDFGAHFTHAIQIEKIVAKEVNRAVIAAKETQGRVLKIACVCCFLAGIVVAAVFVHLF